MIDLMGLANTRQKAKLERMQERGSVTQTSLYDF
jgi:hypothetical protein